MDGSQLQKKRSSVVLSTDEAQSGPSNESSVADLNFVKAALRRSEERFRVAQELALDGFMILAAVRGKDGLITDFRWEYVNPAAARFLRHTLDELVGQQLLRVLPGNLIKMDLIDCFVRVVETGNPHEYELSYESNGILGGFRYVTVKLEDGIAVYFTEITDRELTEDALRRLNEELEKRVELRTIELLEKDQVLLVQSRQAAMGEVIGNIAHQWRQPLNGIGLTIQSLLMLYDMKKLSRSALEKAVAKSMELIQKMSKTIDDYKNYFRPDKEKVSFKISELVSDALSLVDDSIRNQHIAVEIVADPDSSIHGYRNEFVQALLNILKNARDALKERHVSNPRIIITIQNEDGATVLTVADNAGGIPDHIMAKIFEPPFSTKGSQQGMGAGLFISKIIIEKNLGGRFSVRNNNDGAEFRIEL